MDFKDTIQQIVEKIAKQKDSIATEEATKTSFVMPVIAALGYDVFNPFEVVPEMDCDLVKTNEWIDIETIDDIFNYADGLKEGLDLAKKCADK